MKFAVFTFLILISLTIEAKEISVTTYNINYSFINKDLVSILDSINSDIVCLQETNIEWEKILKKDLLVKYPYMEFKHCCTAGGLAILSKYPIQKCKYLKNNIGWFPAMIVNISAENNLIQVLNTHLKPKLTKKGRIGWNAYFKAEEVHQQELTYFISELDIELPTLILGDFNENDKGESLNWLVKEKGYSNSLPAFDKKTKTWRFGFLKGRFDHIFYNQQISCTAAQVSKLGKSDHFPVSAVFKINE